MYRLFFLFYGKSSPANTLKLLSSPDFHPPACLSPFFLGILCLLSFSIIPETDFIWLLPAKHLVNTELFFVLSFKLSLSSLFPHVINLECLGADGSSR